MISLILKLVAFGLFVFVLGKNSRYLLYLSKKIYSGFLFWLRVPFIKAKLPWFSSVSNDKSKCKSLQYADFYNEYKNVENTPIVGIYTMFFSKSALILDPHLIDNVFKKFEYFQNREMYKNDKDSLTANLGTLKYAEWKPLRTKLTKAFSPLKLKCMIPTILHTGNRFVDVLSENQIEICDIFDRFMIDTIGAVSFGLECNTLTNPDSELRKMLQKAKKTKLPFPWNFISDSIPSIARFFGRTKHDKGIAEFFVRFFRAEIEKRRNDKIARGDYLDILIECKNELGRSENETVALAFDLLSAGSTDASIALTYCIYELSLEENIHIQNKARCEIRSVLEEYNGLTYEALSKLDYCKMILNETLRKHPVPGSATRVATKEYPVPNTDSIIPQGMRVIIPIYAIHHDERFYPNPHEFNPERFKKNPAPYFPFGDGPRKCLGERFAKFLVTIGLVFFIDNFEFQISEQTETPILYSTEKNTLVPRSNIWLNVTRAQAPLPIRMKLDNISQKNYLTD